MMEQSVSSASEMSRVRRKRQNRSIELTERPRLGKHFESASQSSQSLRSALDDVDHLTSVHVYLNSPTCLKEAAVIIPIEAHISNELKKYDFFSEETPEADAGDTENSGMVHIRSNAIYTPRTEKYLETVEYRSGLVGYCDHGDEPECNLDDCPSLSSGSTVSSRNPSARSSTASYSSARDQTRRQSNISQGRNSQIIVKLSRPFETCPLKSCEYHLRGFSNKYQRDFHVVEHFTGPLECGFCPKDIAKGDRSFHDCESFRRHLSGIHKALEIYEERLINPGEKETTDLDKGVRGDTIFADCNLCCKKFDPPRMWSHLQQCVLDWLVENSKDSAAPVDLTSPLVEEEIKDTTISEAIPSQESHSVLEPTKAKSSPSHSRSSSGRIRRMQKMENLPRFRDSVSHCPSPTTSDERLASDAETEETDWTEDISIASRPSVEDLPQVRPILSPLKQQIVNDLMRVFNMQFDAGFGIQTCNGGNSRNTEKANPNTTTHSLSRSGAIVGSRKRKGSRGNSPPPPNDGNGEDPNKRRRPDGRYTKQENSPEPRFACPYYKRNPGRHLTFTSCRDPGFTTVARLKEHLYRRHLLPIQCNRCCAIFESDPDLREHQRDPQGCEVKEQLPLEGFDKAQERKLKSKKRNAGVQTEEEKWKGVYRILFPDDAEEDMPSPYCEYNTRRNSVDFNESSNIALFEEYARRELPRLVRRTLEVAVEKEAQPLEERLKDQLVDIVRICHSQLFSAYQESTQRLPTPLSLVPADTLPITNQHSPVKFEQPTRRLVNSVTAPPPFVFPQYDCSNNLEMGSHPSVPPPEQSGSPDSGYTSSWVSGMMDVPIDLQQFPQESFGNLDMTEFENLASENHSSSLEDLASDWSFLDPAVMYGSGGPIS